PRWGRTPGRSGFSSCGAEAFGLDPAGVIAMVDEQRSGRFDKWGRSADEHLGILVRRPRDVLDHRAIHASRVAAPACRLRAGERVRHPERSVCRGEALELLTVDDV